MKRFSGVLPGVLIVLVVVIGTFGFWYYQRKITETPGSLPPPTGVSEVCKNDQECGEGFYCKHGLCTEFLPDVSCTLDDNCQLINKNWRFSCCWVGACERIDYSLDKWIGVNKEWFAEQRDRYCPPKIECGGAPMCYPMPINDEFIAQCIDGMCQKVPK